MQCILVICCEFLCGAQVDDEVPEAEEEKEETDDNPENDSLIKASKAKGKATAKGKAAPAAKGKGAKKG